MRGSAHQMLLAFGSRPVAWMSQVHLPCAIAAALAWLQRISQHRSRNVLQLVISESVSLKSHPLRLVLKLSVRIPPTQLLSLANLTIRTLSRGCSATSSQTPLQRRVSIPYQIPYPLPIPLPASLPIPLPGFAKRSCTPATVLAAPSFDR